MENEKRKILSLTQQLEQLTAGVRNRDPDEVERARALLCRVALYGGESLLALVLHGVISACDSAHDDLASLF